MTHYLLSVVVFCISVEHLLYIECYFCNTFSYAHAHTSARRTLAMYMYIHDVVSNREASKMAAEGDPKTHQFRVPERLVKEPGDLDSWTKSQVRR